MSCQHSSTDNAQTLCQSQFDGSADKVFISDDKQFVSTDFQAVFERTRLYIKKVLHILHI